ncbi:MAG TPA: O-antigen ligase family protein, partial [Ktedonobacteraceae bacterium]|nr:O-antigen ligase family protein [Ktedonobacteraceae bacterium]
MVDKVFLERILSGDAWHLSRKMRLLVAIAPMFLVVLLTLFINRWVDNHLLLKIISMSAISLLFMAPSILLREDELAALFCIVVHVYVDWYLGARYVALGLIMVFLGVRYLTRSPEQVWTLPRMRVLWLLLLLLAIFPALRAYTLQEGATYYLTIFLAALLTFWLGNMLARDIIHVRRLFSLLAAFSTLLALVTLVQALTGKLALYSPRYDQFITQAHDYVLTKGSSIHRIGGWFVDPDWNGAFLAIVVFLPLSLFFVSSRLWTKALYLGEVALILLALLTTYTTGAWIAAIVALFVFLIFLGNLRSRLLLGGLILLGVAIVLLFFHTQLIRQLEHATTTSDFMIRLTAWQTGLRVIRAFPWTGLGLGLHSYLYHMPIALHAKGGYYRALGTPQNSYLEVPAMGGVLLGIVFLALLSLAIWGAWRNWRRAESQTRMLLAGGIAAAISLSVNSLGNQGWTVAVLAAMGWLILGLVSSPLLMRNLSRPVAQAQRDNEQSVDAPEA